MRPPTATGRRLGRYHLVEPIGGGPTGEVFRAKVYGVAGFERQFAVKRFHPEVVGDPQAAARLSTAARAYGSLEHPRIARLYEYGVAGGETFTAVELVAGLDLARLVGATFGAGQPLPAGAALGLVSTAARAVGFAHGRGIQHLGICPTNLIATPDGEVKITDFGVLPPRLPPRPADDPTLAVRLPYLAPEQLVGESSSAATDVFSLGVVAYEIITGERAFSGASTLDIEQAILSGQPREPVLPRPLARVLQRCLARSPFERFPDARALADAIDAALRMAPVAGSKRDIAAHVRDALARWEAIHEQQLSGALNLAMPARPMSGGVAQPMSKLSDTDEITVSRAPFPEPDRVMPQPPPVPPSPLRVTRQAAPPPAPVPPPVPRAVSYSGSGAAPVAGPGVPRPVSHQGSQPVPRPVPHPSSGPVAGAAGVPQRSMASPGSQPVRSPPVAPPPPALAPPGRSTLSAQPPPIPIPDALPLAPSTPTPPPIHAAIPVPMPGSTSGPQAGGDPRGPVPVEAPPPMSWSSGNVLDAAGRPVADGSAPSIALRSGQRGDSTGIVLVPPGANAASMLPPSQWQAQPVAPPRRGSRGAVWAVVGLGAAAVLGVAAFILWDRVLTDANAGATVGLDVDGGVAVSLDAVADSLDAGVGDPPVVAKGGDASERTPHDASVSAEAPSDARVIAAVPRDAATPIETPPDAGANVTTTTGGDLRIESMPPGARVFLDGADQGKTPVKLRGSTDRHSLALIMPGYDLHLEEINGRGKVVVALDEITPSEGRGGIKVRCKVKNRYYVLVDGKPSGMLCPTERIGVTLGEHVVEIYDPISESRRQFPVRVGDLNRSLRVKVD